MYFSLYKIRNIRLTRKERRMKNLIVKHFKKAVVSSCAASLAIVCVGCASAKVQVTSKAPADLVQPDFVLVNNLAVSPENVKIDDGLAAKIERKSKDITQSKEEIKVGNAMAVALTNSIIKYLKMGGIKACKSGVSPTSKTLIVCGKFVRIDRGNQTMRVIIGFGFGNGTMKALIDCVQDNQVVAKGIVTTIGSYKPGILVPVAGGAAAGTIVVSAAVSGAATGVSEGFLATINADADRAGKKIAEKIVQGYINHGWLKPDAIERLNGMF